MKKRVKLMLAALLGFSAACSTVKNASQDNSDMPQPTPAQGGVERIRLMYGAPSPRPVVVEKGELQPVDSARQDRKIQAVEVESPVEKK